MTTSLQDLARSAHQAQIIALREARTQAAAQALNRFVEDFSAHFVEVDAGQRGLRLVADDDEALAVEVDDLVFVYVTAARYYGGSDFLPDGAAASDRLFLLASSVNPEFNPLDRRFWSRPVSDLADLGALLALNSPY